MQFPSELSSQTVIRDVGSVEVIEHISIIVAVTFIQHRQGVGATNFGTRKTNVSGFNPHDDLGFSLAARIHIFVTFICCIIREEPNNPMV